MCVEGVWGLGVALKLQGSFACLALPSANSRQDGHAWHNTILELQCSFNPTKQGLSGHYRCQNTPCIVNERSTATGGVELARCPGAWPRTARPDVAPDFGVVALGFASKCGSGCPHLRQCRPGHKC
jgi:hypothetical protein